MAEFTLSLGWLCFSATVGETRPCRTPWRRPRAIFHLILTPREGTVHRYAPNVGTLQEGRWEPLTRAELLCQPHCSQGIPAAAQHTRVKCTSLSRAPMASGHRGFQARHGGAKVCGTLGSRQQPLEAFRPRPSGFHSSSTPGLREARRHLRAAGPRPGFAPPAASRPPLPLGGGAQPLPRPRAHPSGGGTAPPRVPGPRGKGDEADGRVPGEGTGAGPARTARGPRGTRSAEPRGDADTDADADTQPGRGAHSPARAARGRQAPRAASSSSSSGSAPRRAATILQRRGRGRGAAGLRAVAPGSAGRGGAGRCPPPRGAVLAP